MAETNTHNYVVFFFFSTKNQDQRFSAQAAGVSSVLLIVSIIGAFTPTVFYQIHGGYQLECRSCNTTALWGSTHGLDCQGCQLQQVRPLYALFIFLLKYLFF